MKIIFKHKKQHSLAYLLQFAILPVAANAPTALLCTLYKWQHKTKYFLGMV